MNREGVNYVLIFKNSSNIESNIVRFSVANNSAYTVTHVAHFDTFPVFSYHGSISAAYPELVRSFKDKLDKNVKTL